MQLLLLERLVPSRRRHVFCARLPRHQHCTPRERARKHAQAQILFAMITYPSACTVQENSSPRASTAPEYTNARSHPRYSPARGIDLYPIAPVQRAERYTRTSPPHTHTHTYIHTYQTNGACGGKACMQNRDRRSSDRAAAEKLTAQERKRNRIANRENWVLNRADQDVFLF